MSKKYQHLGIFSDWVAAAQQEQKLWPAAEPGPETQRRFRQVLGFTNRPDTPVDVKTEQRWERDGLAGQVVSWSVGYGPRTRAWVLKPAGATHPLPGILALHDHGDFKFYGKEKIAAGPDTPPQFLMDRFGKSYGGRAFANELAREGFVVVIHDVFLWGSRKFPLDAMAENIRATAIAAKSNWWPNGNQPYDVAEYNAVAALHEHTVEKYCNLLGTTLAGVVSFEDRVAFNYLLSRDDVLEDHCACIGLSGGGNRSAMLLATHDRVAAAVIVGLMSTYEGLLDHNMSHTWMLLPHGWSRFGDWPDVAACRAPLPLLVQYDLDDELFTVEGMRAAHQRIAERYAGAGHPEAYTGQFYPGPHKFGLQMQRAAFAWLAASI
ncbi:MAG: acetylesterase [Chloroflexi bacterium]|nr:MAG: acetylesterase [Chloroflexota bacterium]